ncbi:hypothetical protein CEXT_232201 [Caerostris extrusa]|uniref:Reverse transcriptase n=1 Tax=Caerostris extrusa TaxID=172846 RepID=A0AAV4M712_CAEEX|nr:hypothetical protein CEXT_232201 [Caerostris extrusa]
MRVATLINQLKERRRQDKFATQSCPLLEESNITFPLNCSQIFPSVVNSVFESFLSLDSIAIDNRQAYASHAR